LLAPSEAWLNRWRTLLWWLVAYLLVVVIVAALAHVFGASTPGFSEPLRGAD
jgi:hypothetical protein